MDSMDSIVRLCDSRATDNDNNLVACAMHDAVAAARSDRFVRAQAMTDQPLMGSIGDALDNELVVRAKVAVHRYCLLQRKYLRHL